MRIILAYDDQDASLGTFFQACAQDITQYIQQHTSFQISSIDSNSLSMEAIDKEVTTMDEPFLFLAYSHGIEDQLCCDNYCREAYVKTPGNTYLFSRSFFYTFSCKTAEILGEVLAQNQQMVYIGYTGVVEGDNDMIMNDLVECTNYGVKLFLQGKSQYEVVSGMWEKYTDCLVKWLDLDEGKAVIFRRNRDALCPRGENLDISQL